MCLDNMYREREELESKISECRSNIMSAKAKQKMTGEYADPEEFARWKQDVASYTNQLHNLNRQIKTYNRSESSGKIKNAMFIEVARNILPSDTFQKIENMTQERMNSLVKSS